jgi:hypothetical protein
LPRHLTFDLRRACVSDAHRVYTLAKPGSAPIDCLALARPRTILLLAAFAPARIV